MTNRLIAIAVITLFVAGCATGGTNYQPELQQLNSRISSLQNQLSAKDLELRSLQDQISSFQQQLGVVNRAKDKAEAQLYSALEKLAKKEAGASKASKKADSYIK